MATAYAGLALLAGAYCGFDPEVWTGIYVGTFAGLVSLVVELAVVGRSMRLFNENGLQATLMTFTMRLGAVGGLGVCFLADGSWVDLQAFCLSYCATFFIYMCWLTWRTAKQPTQFERRQAANASAQREVAQPQIARFAAGGVR